MAVESAEPPLELPNTFHLKGRRLGVDKDEKLLLTLSRGTEADPWGFSLVGARDVLEQGGFWSGVVTTRHQTGVWLAVQRVREETAAGESGLRKGDLITRINGRIVFHLTAEDIQRLIANSGTSLFLDIERNRTKHSLYNTGLHQYSFNFLCRDMHADRVVGEYSRNPRW